MRNNSVHKRVRAVSSFLLRRSGYKEVGRLITCFYEERNLLETVRDSFFDGEEVRELMKKYIKDKRPFYKEGVFLRENRA